MNKKYLSLLLGGTLVLSACSEKTAEEYSKEYSKSPEAAVEKLKECKEQFQAALKENNKELVEKLKNDIGCNVASEEFGKVLKKRQEEKLKQLENKQ